MKMTETFENSVYQATLVIPRIQKWYFWRKDIRSNKIKMFAKVKLSDPTSIYGIFIHHVVCHSFNDIRVFGSFGYKMSNLTKFSVMLKPFLPTFLSERHFQTS